MISSQCNDHFQKQDPTLTSEHNNSTLNWQENNLQPAQTLAGKTIRTAITVVHQTRSNTHSSNTKKAQILPFCSAVLLRLLICEITQPSGQIIA